MDPLSVAASVAGLLTLAGSLISKGYTIISRLNDHKDISTLLNEITRFSGVLIGLRSHFSSLGENAPTIPSLDKDTLDVTVGGCEQILSEMSRLLEKVAKTNTVGLLLKSTSIDEQVGKLVSRLEGYKSFFVLCLQLQSNTQSQTTSRLTHDMLSIINDISLRQLQMKDESEQKEITAMRDKIIDWLGPTTESTHEDVSFSRDSGSAAWIFERDEFRTWLSGEASFLWLCGTQGMGKTVIASSVIDNIRERELDGAVVAYHYCHFSDSLSILPQRILGALLCQLLKTSQVVSLPPKLVKIFDRYRARSTYPTFKELRIIFEEQLRRYSKSYIIIDGLDELSTRHEIVELLTELSLSANGICKLLVSSRPEPDLKKAFLNLGRSIRITPKDIERDLGEYATSQISQLRLDKDEAEILARELVNRSEGMFLWAVCQLKQLSRVRTAIDADTLKALPSGLSETFEAQLRKLNEDDLAIALKAIRLVMYAHRDLDLNELVEALAIDDSIRNLRQLQRNTLRNPMDIFEICGCLVKQLPSTGKVSLAHYSIYEFFSTPFLESRRRNEYFLPKAESEESIFNWCTIYLSLDDYNSTSFEDSIAIALQAQDTELMPQAFSDSSFLDYAVNFWWQHVRELTADSFERIWPILQEFVSPKRRNFRSLVLIGRYLNDEYQYPTGADAIHIAAMHGLNDFATLLMKQDPKCSTLATADGRTPIHIASEQGNNKLLQILLERATSGKSSSSILEAKDSMGRTALHVAVECGNTDAVNMLVSAGAYVDTASNAGTTPISIAIENKWEDFAERFTELSVNLEAKIEGKSLLHLAAQSGSLPWTTALIAVAKKLTASKDENDWMPIHFASHNGHAEVVRYLLSSGSHGMPGDKNGWTPLHAAIKERRLSCATVLLETEHIWEKSVLGRSETYEQMSEATMRHPLLSLRSSSSEKYGGYLQRREETRLPASRHSSTQGRPNPMQEKPTAPSPLFIAVSESYEEAVELLMSHSKTILSFFSDDLLSCCQKALYNDHPSNNIVKCLLRGLETKNIYKVLGISPSKEPPAASIAVLKQVWSDSYVYGTLFPSAINTNLAACQFFLAHWKLPEEGVKVDLVHELLERSINFGGSINARGIRTVRMEPENDAKVASLIQTLAQNGVPLSKHNSRGYTPLQTCIEQHRYQLARLFLDWGCRDSDLSKDGETALLVLLKNPNLEEEETRRMFDLLVKGKADINAIDLKGQGACHKIASSQISLDILNWLLEHGVPPDIRDKAGVTPIQIALHVGSMHVLNCFFMSLKGFKNSFRLRNIVDYYNPGNSPLMVAVKKQDGDMLTCLIDYEKVGFTAATSDEMESLKPARAVLYAEALCNAMQDRTWSGFESLLAAIPDISCKTTTGSSPLHMAVLKDNLGQQQRYIMALLKKGADVNAKRAPDDATPAEVAYSRDSSSTLALLLRHGAQPQPEYMTLAIRHKNLELAVALFESDFTLQAGHLELIKESILPIHMTRLFLQNGAQVQPEYLLMAIHAGDSELLKKVISAFPDDTDSQITGLLLARMKQKSLVEILMEKVQDKLDVAIGQIEPDTAGGTILHSATRRKRIDQMKYILASELRADLLEARDKVGYTALMAAINTFNWKCAELLIRCGANVDEAKNWVKKWPTYGWDVATIINLAHEGPQALFH
ncbi:Ankyrin-1 [Paramyrothecium foliicola]|nr:Ankyrin-1 [Paramyrothecium foliicola]